MLLNLLTESNRCVDTKAGVFHRSGHAREIVMLPRTPQRSESLSRHCRPRPIVVITLPRSTPKRVPILSRVNTPAKLRKKKMIS